MIVSRFLLFALSLCVAATGMGQEVKPLTPEHKFEPKIQIGADAGYVWLRGDVPSRVGYSAALRADATLSGIVTFGLRFEHGDVRGQSLQQQYGGGASGNQNPWYDLYPDKPVFPNYHLKYEHYAINACYYPFKGKQFYYEGGRFTPYLMLSGSWFRYLTMVDAKNGDKPYDFSQLSRYPSRSDLQSFFDHTYETPAEGFDGGKRLGFTSVNLGAGANVKLTKHLALSLGAELQFAVVDVLDGQQWIGTPSAGVQQSGRNDYIFGTKMGIIYIFGNTASQKETLDSDNWWKQLPAN